MGNQSLRIGAFKGRGTQWFVLAWNSEEMIGFGGLTKEITQHQLLSFHFYLREIQPSYLQYVSLLQVQHTQVHLK